ncbi:TonB-dependent receptor [Salinibacter altiplanensis]|uniref:TonB-dependent receptor n=1 Tax=Salinibacter altiplanensis TaxID=1803181 RepID=UPI0018E47952|nr:TonB-dependent receptor [Salinibacter altiplanensis]
MTIRYASILLVVSFAWGLVAGAPAHAQQAATLSGRVVGPSENPLPGANVVFVDSDYGTATGPNGSYTITDIEPGSYTVRVTFVGYETVEREFALEAGTTAQGRFVLERAPLQGEGVTVTVGSRARDMAAEDMATPVDVYGTEEIQTSGAFETGRILQQSAPSVNFPQNTLSDGMDALRSFTLRGLSPDQTLVLVNGKRRHKSALVNRLGAGVSGGSSPIDLNAIPSNAIERIEVLRDGASSQYGSDAIAGVANLRLKDEPLDPTVETRIGGYVTNPYSNDGTTYSVRPSFGVELGDDGGFLNFFGEYRLRTPTNRAGPADFNLGPAGQGGDEIAGPDEDGLFDIVDKNNSVEQPAFHWGDGRSENLLFWANGAYPISDLNADQPTEIYAFGGYSYRKGKGQGFYREGTDDGNWPQIYPEGFLPNFENPINDGSVVVGLRGVLDEWNYDLSAQTGFNYFQYNITNTLNASFGPTQGGNQTEFYAGSVQLQKTVVQLDVDRGYEVGLASPLNVAAGALFRADTYELEAGEEASWAGFTEDAPWQINQNGGVPAPGAQVFPGFRPSQEVDETRTNVGAYVDLQTDLIDPLQLNVAGRVENYSDFGSTVNGKVALRFEPISQLAFRGTAQTGYRAPNQAQKFFSKVSTTFIDNQPVQTGIFRINSDIGNALGIPDLDEERSVNFSGGVVIKPIERFQVSVDYFNIQIDDRITLSGDLGEPGSPGEEAINQVLRENNTGAESASFFSNAIDTNTEGIDVTSKFSALLADGVQLQLRGAFNWTDTEITGGPRNPTTLNEDFSTVILAPDDQRALTDGALPETTTKLTASLTAGPVDLTLRGARYGELLNADDDADDEFTLDPEYVFGGELGYNMFDDQVSLAVGARNLFDNYPDLDPQKGTFDIILPYNRAHPIGFNGRFVYSRLTISL